MCWDLFTILDTCLLEVRLLILSNFIHIQISLNISNHLQSLCSYVLYSVLVRNTLISHVLIISDTLPNFGSLPPLLPPHFNFVKFYLYFNKIFTLSKIKSWIFIPSANMYICTCNEWDESLRYLSSAVYAPSS